MSNPEAVSKLTDAEKLSALTTYLKVLAETEKALRVAVVEDMAERHVEKVGAYLPDGTKMASVSRTPGKKAAKVTDPAAALRWCMKRYPEEIVSAINPAFLAKILTYSQAVGAVGEPGADPTTGELLDFIEVQQGSAYVTVTTTADGKARMAALAHGFAGMLEAGPEDPR